MRDAIGWVLRIVTSYHDIPWTTDSESERLGEFVDLQMPRSSLPCGCADLSPTVRVLRRNGRVSHTRCGGGITTLPVWITDPEGSRWFQTLVERIISELQEEHPDTIRWRRPARRRRPRQWEFLDLWIKVEDPPCGCDLHSQLVIPALNYPGFEAVAPDPYHTAAGGWFRVWRPSGLVVCRRCGRDVARIRHFTLKDLPVLKSGQTYNPEGIY